MAEISIGNRRVQVPDDLDPKKPSAAAPQLRGNAFGDAAARTVAPGTVTPSLTGNPIAANPGMTGNPDNARFMKEAQMRVDPVQTAARNAAYAPERPAPYSKWSPFESEVRTGGNPGFGGGNTTPQADAWKFEQQVRNNPQMLRANNPTIAELPAAGGPKPSLRAGVAAEKSLLGKTAYAGGRMLAPVAKFATGVGGRALVGADVVGHFNDYKLNDPGVDSSASGTAAAFMQDRQEASDKGDWGGGRGFSRTRASLGKGLLETGMDLGGFVASTADLPFKVAGALGYKGDTSPVSQKYTQLLRDQFGDQLVVSGEQKQPGVAAQQPGGGAAPASAAKPGAANAPSKPSAPIQFGPTDGPQQPEGLRTSVVRVGNSYSGPEGVGGDIRINNQAGRGTVTMMGGNPGDLTSAQRMAMDQRAHDIEMQSAGLRQQIMDRASGAPAPGAFILGGETQGSALRKQFDSTPSASILGRQGLSDRQRAADDRAKARDALDERRILMGDETQRRGQDIIGQGQMLQHGAQLRGQDLVHGAALRGQDLDYAGKMAPVEAAKARREMVQRVMGSKEVGGDPIKGAQVLASMGFADEAKDFMGQARDKQTMEHSGTNNAKDAFKNQFFRTDDKGNRVRDEESEGEAYRRVMDKYGGEFTKLPQPEQEAAMSQARAETLILRSANKKRGTRVTDFMGTTPPAFSNLPTADQVKGLQLGRLGFWDDMFTTGPRDQGDHTLTWKDKNGDEQTMYVDPETMEQADVTRYLRGGAQIRK